MATRARKERSKFKEVERIYFCNFPNCSKGYGRLNHLNDHIKIQKHGAIRKPSEFALVRKQLKKRRLQEEILQETLSAKTVVDNSLIEDEEDDKSREIIEDDKININKHMTLPPITSISPHLQQQQPPPPPLTINPYNNNNITPPKLTPSTILPPIVYPPIPMMRGDTYDNFHLPPQHHYLHTSPPPLPPQQYPYQQQYFKEQH